MKNKKEISRKTKEGIGLSKKQIAKIKVLINNIETSFVKLKSIVSDDDKKIFEIDTKNAKDYIEGIFDGRFMVDKKGKKYLVPENYASKSKLVAGDSLKLVFSRDGTYVYKQISPVERKKELGVLQEQKGNYQAKTDKKTYKVLKASVTYFKARAGDKLTIIIPRDKESKWAAIENKIG